MYVGSIGLHFRGRDGHRQVFIGFGDLQLRIYTNCIIRVGSNVAGLRGIESNGRDRNLPNARQHRRKAVEPIAAGGRFLADALLHFECFDLGPHNCSASGVGYNAVRGTVKHLGE
jgi:hypothetical protein